MTRTLDIQHNLNSIRERIAEAALTAGRSAQDIRLVAVSKTYPVEAVVAAYEAGQRDFGENRPEEAQPKIKAVQQALPDSDLAWHMIGHIQSRKARLVVTGFAMVHSVDRLSIAQKLSAIAVQHDTMLPVLLECNVSGEASKSGFAAAGWEQDAVVRQALLHTFAAIAALPGLKVNGLMTMAPFVDDDHVVRGTFASLRNLREHLRESIPEADWQHLSMGMSGDFELAIAEGATFVRVGTAIFGHRI